MMEGWDSILFWVMIALWVITPAFIFYEEISERRERSRDLAEEAELEET